MTPTQLDVLQAMDEGETIVRGPDGVFFLGMTLRTVRNPTLEALRLAGWVTRGSGESWVITEKGREAVSFFEEEDGGGKVAKESSPTPNGR